MPSYPAWKGLVATLCARIEDGTYPVGSQLPPYRDLAAEHGLSLTPVRVAYRHLMNAGVVSGQRGVGVFVRALPGPDAAPEPTPAELIEGVRVDLGRQIATLSDQVRRLAAVLESHLKASQRANNAYRR